MQRLICSLVTVVSLSVPSSALAQYYPYQEGGTQYGHQQKDPDYLELWFRDGRRVVTYPVSGTRHEDVAAQHGIAYCEQYWRRVVPPPGFGYAAVISQGPCKGGQTNHQPINRYSGQKYQRRWVNPVPRQHLPILNGGSNCLLFCVN